MEVSKELQELTNKFLEEFLELASKTENRGKRDDLYHFNFTLAEAIGNSNYPKYEEQLNILMGMSSFDDSIAKIMFNQRIQGFIPIIENKLAYKGEQDDFRIENINKTKSTEKDFKLKFLRMKKGKIHLKQFLQQKRWKLLLLMSKTPEASGMEVALS
jgi:ssDNA-binding Zn-finger/Zn-ribbon topoisomerase 1